MRVRFLTGMVSIRHEWMPGNEYNLEDDEAKRLISAGIVEAVRGPIETASTVGGRKQRKRVRR